MTRLKRFQVHGLLGRFTHTLEFQNDWEFIIIHGPNGVGKTRILEMIANTFSVRASQLAATPFENAIFDFDDGTRLSLIRRADPTLPFSQEVLGDPVLSSSLTYSLQSHNLAPITWAYKPVTLRDLDFLERDLYRFLPIERHGPDRLIDPAVGDIVSLAEAVERYGDMLPTRGEREPVPDAMQTFLDSIDIHLIETQRLLRFRPRTRGSKQERLDIAERATVVQFSQELTRRIGQVLAENSRISQERDRTFPGRILEQGQDPSDSASDDDIKERYQNQQIMRRRLAELSILDAAPEVVLPTRELKDWERRVLWMYLEDSEVKLATFRGLLERIALLQEVVNSRFLYKELHIDSEKGIRFVTDDGHELGPDKLSSGEQHELVLLYDLLFNVQPSSLVLIDEPEISLHVGWQQQFLNDIQRIGALAGLQFIVATHSPQIIHDWWERAIALPQDEIGGGS